ncbi:DNA sulfur modification protein DndE [candidate division KSB1 bacterium]|nr:DNA sulfur modification protein DndE [candidate division KSB1 bacterium]
MSSRLKISKKASEQLDHLSNRLDQRRNIICRLAIGRSLAEKKSVKNLRPKDSAGYEFNRYTLTGEYDDIFKALVNQHERKRMDDREYISIFIRNHIERGIQLLYIEYQRINSPIDFFAVLFKSDK